VFERKEELRGVEGTVGGLARHEGDAAERKREGLPDAWHDGILPAPGGAGSRDPGRQSRLAELNVPADRFPIRSRRAPTG
jgi:hypothetical protein